MRIASAGRSSTAQGERRSGVWGRGPLAPQPTGDTARSRVEGSVAGDGHRRLLRSLRARQERRRVGGPSHRTIGASFPSLRRAGSPPEPRKPSPSVFWIRASALGRRKAPAPRYVPRDGTAPAPRCIVSPSIAAWSDRAPRGCRVSSRRRSCGTELRRGSRATPPGASFRPWRNATPAGGRRQAAGGAASIVNPAPDHTPLGALPACHEVRAL